MDFGRKMLIGSLPEDVGSQFPTAGSSRANRHMSTKGKSDSIGNVDSRILVTWLHDASRAGVAEGNVVLAFPSIGGTNLSFRYLATSFIKIFLTVTLGKAEDAVQTVESMKLLSFVTTVSIAGACWNKMGLIERSLIVGRARPV